MPVFGTLQATSDGLIPFHISSDVSDEPSTLIK